MSTPRVVLAPQLLQKLPSKKQPLSCTNLVGENARESGPPGKPEARRHRLRPPRRRPPRPRQGHQSRTPSRAHRRPPTTSCPPPRATKGSFMTGRQWLGITTP